MPVSKQFGTQMKTFGTDAESEYVSYMSGVRGRKGELEIVYRC